MRKKTHTHIDGRIYIRVRYRARNHSNLSDWEKNLGIVLIEGKAARPPLSVRRNIISRHLSDIVVIQALIYSSTECPGPASHGRPITSAD